MVVYKALNTIIESIVINGGHTIRDSDGGQALAEIESVAANGGHTIGNSYGGQALAGTESIFTNGGHDISCP